MIERLRAWAERYTREGRYSPVGQAFHWIMAGLISFQLFWGWQMGRIDVGSDKRDAFSLHAGLGLLILLLAGLRFLWRMAVPGPVNDADRLGWQTKVAHVTHLMFYICFFGLPLTGWAMWSALDAAEPLFVLGLLPWPLMPFEDVPTPIRWLILDWSEGFHALLVLVLLGLIPAHVGAALKHHFWDRHDVLEGMLPDLDGGDEGASEAA